MKNLKNIILSLILVGACSGAVMAAEFTPLNFSDATYSDTTKIAASNTSATSANNAAKPAVSDTTGNKNMQSAISQLDNAQVEVRNELLNYKTKYSEVDAKYNTIKEERSTLHKQIRACERKIKRLDNAKEKIRKNML